MIIYLYESKKLIGFIFLILVSIVIWKDVINNVNNQYQVSWNYLQNTSDFTWEINIAFLWDVMIWWRVRESINKKGLDYVFNWTRDYLFKKDLVVLNLETTITDILKNVHKTYTFKADKKHLEWLKLFNKNIYVNLANNHTWDFWASGMLDTMKNLDMNNIGYFGLGNNLDEANEIKIVNIKGTKIWLLWQNCISPNSFKATDKKIWTAFFDKKKLKEQIKYAKEKNVDIIVLNWHCWIEYTNGPNKEQKDYYHTAIDEWVDLVIWHHPHWYQWIEKYNWKIIFYSLWDYIFDIFRGRRTQEWIIANIVIQNKKIKNIEIKWVHIYGYGNTQFATDKQTKVILQELQSLSNKLSNIDTIINGYITDL